MDSELFMDTTFHLFGKLVFNLRAYVNSILRHTLLGVVPKLKACYSTVTKVYFAAACLTSAEESTIVGVAVSSSR